VRTWILEPDPVTQSDWTLVKEGAMWFRDLVSGVPSDAAYPRISAAAPHLSNNWIAQICEQVRGSRVAIDDSAWGTAIEE
jgi:hypothetical protein